MYKRDCSAAVNLDVDAAAHTKTSDLRQQLDPDRDFRILILGDFSGRQVLSKLPVNVDRDNFEEVMAKMNVRLELNLGTAGITLPMQFRELADFEPDRIYEQYEVFRNLYTKSAGPRPPRNVGPSAVGRADLSALASGNLLDNIVDVSESDRPVERRPKDELQRMVEEIVAPHVVSKEDDVARATNERAAILMRAVLHHADFQALEAAWRAVWKLVRDLDTDDQLKIYLLNLPKSGIAEHLASGEVLRQQRWAVLAGNYVFDRSEGDLELLARLGSIAHSLQAPFLAEAAPPDDGDSENRNWLTLRRSPAARWIGLALPRFLLRRPYTSESYAAEKFRFEEMPPRPNHGHYLWGNPAFACAYLLGQSFNQYGWDFRPGMVQQMDSLPFHSYTLDGEVHAQPCAEILMTEHEADYILDHGFMPLASIKGTDSIRLVRFQSIAEPLAPLAGPWG